MKLIVFLAGMAVAALTNGQQGFPDFLQGTWKMEDKDIYEHWDKLSNQNLKGLSYRFNDGQIVVNEYLEIIKQDNEIIYTANVINQNQGKGIDFKLTQSDSMFTFENPLHDFPKKIVYQKLSDTLISVQISDGKQEGYGYRLTKQNVLQEKNDSAIENPNYDKELATRLGGDDYGMKSYFFVVLKTGSSNTTDKSLIQESFKGHMANINRLVEEGKLVVAGPLGKNENNYRGIFILSNIETQEFAEEILQSDPAIKNNLLDYSIYTWYGSAALPEYLPFSDKVWRLKF
jgi:uncharacterized protein YciI